MNQDLENNPTLDKPGRECIPLADMVAMVGVNHRAAPIEIREKLAVPGTRIEAMMQSLRESLGLSELVILSTCNRTEFYWASEKALDPMEFFRALPALDSEILAKLAVLAYRFQGKEAARHLMEVTAGLDSLVLGETQVSGQVRSAYEESREKGLTGSALNFLFQKAFETVKKVHTETALLAQKASIPSVALEFAKAIFGELEDTYVLVIGTGEIAELTLQLLQDRGVKKIGFVTRSAERAVTWQSQCVSAEVTTLDNIQSLLPKADIVIACTSADKPVLTSADIIQARLTRQRRFLPLLILDLGLPRNVAPEVGKLQQVYLKDIDDLQEVVEKNKVKLEAEVLKARALISAGVSDYVQFCRSATAAGTIKELRALVEEIARKELERTLGKLSDLSPEQKQMIEELVHRLQAKILHNPSERIRFISRDGQGQEAVEWARMLFGLDPLDSAFPHSADAHSPPDPNKKR